VSAVSVSPRLRVAFLVGVAVGAFLLPRWWMVAGVAAAMAIAWLAVGLGARPLVRQATKLVTISIVIVLGYALFAEDPATDRWVTLDLHWWELDVNVSGAAAGLAMALRILTVVLASQVARAGDMRALARGLGQLGMPRMAAVAVDATLVLLDGGGGGGGRGRGGGGGGRGRGGGRGGGGGGGRGGGGGGGEPGGFRAGLRRLAKGDVSALIDPFRRHVARVEQHLAETAPDLPPHALRDVAIIAGVALTMLGIKMLKLLPGVPFAPGHKGVLLIPLYLAAGVMTRSKVGATLTGLTMGTVAFLLGDGRYGVFEIAKHVAPGIIVDLLIAPTRRLARGGRTRRVVAWSVLGLLAALGRFATITLVALAVQPPAIVYAVLLPGLLVHGIFGALSGLVTAPLIAALDRQSENEDP
jgi:hypothetical protein